MSSTWTWVNVKPPTKSCNRWRDDHGNFGRRGPSRGRPNSRPRSGTFSFLTRTLAQQRRSFRETNSLNSVFLAGRDIRPQGIQLLWFEKIAPWRHLVLASCDRCDEALTLARRKFPQVERH